MCCRNWLTDARDGGRWRHLLEEAKVPTQGCGDDDDDDDDINSHSSVHFK